jgi:hypothetical protein
MWQPEMWQRALPPVLAGADVSELKIEAKIRAGSPAKILVTLNRYERMLKSDVKYRFVIDMASLKGNSFSD